jgi:hypothetical protein
MTTTIIATAKDLDLEGLKVMSTHTGPCITLVVPDRHPGAPEGARRNILRGLLKSVSEQLESGRLAPETPSLLEPLEEMCEDSALDTGGQGLAIFRSPGFVACYRVSSKTERLSIANHFLLAPFVADALLPASLFVLGLSTKHLRLFRCSRHECQEIVLPEGVPKSIEAAGQFDRSERTLENRSTAGSSTGELRRVRFGTATDRDTSGAYLHDFFETVHRGLKPLLAGRPLVLMGVQEEIAAYRRIAGTGASVLADEPGNIEFLSPAEICTRAWKAARAENLTRGEQVLTELREMPNRRHVATEAQEVLRAAVHRLCVRVETELIAPTESGNEDLVNAAIAETLRTSGEVSVLHQDCLPADQPLAAILRY